jgi:hypothetical protein
MKSGSPRGASSANAGLRRQTNLSAREVRSATTGYLWHWGSALVGPWNGKGPRSGALSGSRPVSRILSCATIHLSGRPGPRRAACKRSCLALHRVGFAWPPRHRDAGALLPHLFNLAGPRRTSQPRTWAVCFLWHFPAGFPGSALPTTLPCDVRTFLEGVVPPQLLGLQDHGSAPRTFCERG